MTKYRCRVNTEDISVSADSPEEAADSVINKLSTDKELLQTKSEVRCVVLKE